MITLTEARSISSFPTSPKKPYKALWRISELILAVASQGLFEAKLEGDDLKSLHKKELEYVQDQLIEAGFDVDLFPPCRENGNVWEMDICWK